MQTDEQNRDETRRPRRPGAVFIVEDHAAMRQALRQLLEGETSLTVVGEAESAEQALDRLAAAAPDPVLVDLVLVDLGLPGANGLELIRRLRAERPDLPCVMVTAHGDARTRRRALAAGAAGFASKSDPDAILAAVRAALGA